MKRDFSKGRISINILHQAVPLMVAQLVQLLYNVIDRIYIGHLPQIGSAALTGIGLVFPVTTMITAFISLYSSGGTPLFSIARGMKEDDKAENILGQVVTLLTLSSVILMIICYLFRKPILYAFGASDSSYIYADMYLQIYLVGTLFSMLTTGLNGFISAQGYPGTGMCTVLIGAILNLLLDPLFIYGFNWGVRGAAVATVISQLISFLWIVRFFAGKKNEYRIRKKYLILKAGLVKNIVSLGLSGFVMQGTNCIVQVVCNKMLQMYGGDLYIGVMTVLNSVREILSIPGSTLGQGSQPVLGYNFGAKEYRRVKQAIRFTALIAFVYMFVAWLFVIILAGPIMSVFTSDSQMIEAGKEALKLYFFGFFFMGFQFVGQSTFTGLGCARRAIFFSLFRKVIIVVPLTIILPSLGMGITGVLVAEPVSNVIGGLASFITMYLTLYKKLPEDGEIAHI